jgi:exopolysaccharide biosynthesis polyprenyl glycosylphosphotransferase
MRHKWRGSRTGERVAVVFVTAISLAFAVVSLPWQPLEVDVVAAVAVCVAAALCWSLRPAQRPTRIAVIGRQRAVVALIEELEINGIADHTTVGWIATDRCVVPAFPYPEALGGIGQLASVVREHRIDLLLLGSDVPRLAVFDELVRSRNECAVRVCDLTAFYEDLFGHIPVSEINSTWFQYIMHPRFRATTSNTKRIFDLLVATLLGIGVLPLLALAAALIKLDGGPVLYRQQRIGEQGRAFWMYKLRTMRHGDEDHAQVWCADGDPRVTRVGRVLRRSSLDELPQLVNVLRGEMSLVGPRPLVGEDDSRIQGWDRHRLHLTPGITGPWQVLGPGRLPLAEMVKLDYLYVAAWSLWGDVKILLRTLAFVLGRKGI